MSLMEIYFNFRDAPCEDRRRAELAAHAVFEAEGVNPIACARAHFKLYDEVEELTDEEERLCDTWNRASAAAFEACCADWPDKPAETDRLGIRVVLSEAHQIAKAAWLEEAEAEMRRLGLSREKAADNAENDWLTLSSVDRSPGAALRQDPSQMAPGDTTVGSRPDERDRAEKDDGDNSGSPSYVARVALDRTSFIIDGEERVLGPGMAVTAEIKTGSRRILSYLLSPLRRYAQDAGRER